MKTNLVDKINILLIILSLVLAYLIPFRLFLFSYAVLGPIHYLTEINWLNKRSFFIKEKKWIWFFVLATLFISIPVLLNLRVLSTINQHPLVNYINMHITGLTDVLLLSLFFFAVGLVYIKRWYYLLLFFIGSILLAKVITKYVLFSYVLVGLFLPTLIHVYVFTLLFMLMGTLASGSRMGYVAIGLLLVSPFIIWCSPLDPTFYANFEPAGAIQTVGNFRFIQHLQQLFNDVGNQLSFAGIKLQMFLAFCYTYHYLNWFSKTSVIGWHRNISVFKISIIFVLWSALIVLFWYDFETAYLALFFLALLHIILEFPLNVTSIKSIGLSLSRRKIS